TPYITPSIPDNRLQVLYFFLSILIPLLLWRGIYLPFLTFKNNFIKKSVLICKREEVDRLIHLLQGEDPYHAVLACYSEDNLRQTLPPFNNIPIINDIIELETFIKENGVYEIIIGPHVSVEFLNPHLLKLIKNGVVVVGYFYALENYTKKIPVNLIEMDFSIHFNFSISN